MMITRNPAKTPSASTRETRAELRREAWTSLLLAVLWLGGVSSFFAVSLGRRAMRGMDPASEPVHHRVATSGYVLGWIGVGISVLGLLAVYVYISAAGFGMSTKATYPN